MSKDPVPFMPNLRDEALIAQPTDIYSQLHEQDEIYWDPRDEAWIVSRHEDVSKMLRDDRFKVNRMKLYLPRLPEDTREKLMPLFNHFATWMLFQDKPEHTRLRTPVAKAFDSKMVKLWKERTEALADTMVSGLPQDEPFDFISSIAYPLPIAMICEMLGLKTSDREQLHSWTADIAAFLDNSTDFQVAAKALASQASISKYLNDEIEKYRSEPADNLISYLLRLQEQNESITDADILGNAVLIFAAGHETTVALLSNLLLELVRNPEALVAVREDRGLLNAAIEETLRIQPPVHRTGRIVLEPVEWGKINIATGERVSLLLGAANHDPKKFESPGTFKLDRGKSMHLAFSFGAHFCVGANLARMQAVAVFNALLSKYDTIEIQEESVIWKNNLTLRSLQRMDVILRGT